MVLTICHMDMEVIIMVMDMGSTSMENLASIVGMVLASLSMENLASDGSE